MPGTLTTLVAIYDEEKEKIARLEEIQINIDLPGPTALSDEITEMLQERVYSLQDKLSNPSIWKIALFGLTDRVHTLYAIEEDVEGQHKSAAATKLVCTVTENEPCMSIIVELGAYGRIQRVLYMDQDGVDHLQYELDRPVAWYDEKIKLRVWRQVQGPHWAINDLRIQTMDGQTLSLDLGPNGSSTMINNLKLLIYHHCERIRPDQQRLVWRHGEVMGNDTSLRDYEIHDGDTIHVVLRLSGGGIGGSMKHFRVTDKRDGLGDWKTVYVKIKAMLLSGEIVHRTIEVQRGISGSTFLAQLRSSILHPPITTATLSTSPQRSPSTTTKGASFSSPMSSPPASTTDTINTGTSSWLQSLSPKALLARTSLVNPNTTACSSGSSLSEKVRSLFEEDLS